MKKHTIIGTAGHIDHGKTALIKALTGIDADRLKEEKERGITIDIGFAYWREDVTIIDVPGHEKFIRNMVAGVSTIDIFLLVIAADDSIMPQTIEHLDILNFFNHRDGIVVINKIDLVDDEMLELVQEEVQELLQGYGMENLPIVPVSSVQGTNLEQLKKLIDEKIEALEKRPQLRPFRLLVDRSIVFKGVGTVVTGTVLSGQLNKAQTIQILPSGELVKVRSLQTHTHETDSVFSGQRAAVNIPGVARSGIERGDVLAEPNTLMPVQEFLGEMHSVSNMPVKISNRSEVRVYVGTAERMGQLVWFDSVKKLEPQGKYHVRIKLDEPLSAAREDAFLIRLASPVFTLAGGRILEINPPKIQHREEIWRPYFEKLNDPHIANLVESIISHRGYFSVSSSYLQQKLFLPLEDIRPVINDLLKRKRIREISIRNTGHFISEENFRRLAGRIEKYLHSFHEQNAHQPGANLQQLLAGTGLQWIAEELFTSALRFLENSGRIRNEKGMYAEKDFSMRISRGAEDVKEQLLQLFFDARFAPPSLEEISKRIELPMHELRSMTGLLAREGKLLSVQQKFYLHHHRWEELLNFLRQYFSDKNEMPVNALKNFIQTSRKYAIPLFETLDGEGFTSRDGDVRKKGTNL